MRFVCGFRLFAVRICSIGVSERCMTKWYIEDRSDNGLLHVSSFNRSKSIHITLLDNTLPNQFNPKSLVRSPILILILIFIFRIVNIVRLLNSNGYRNRSLFEGSFFFFFEMIPSFILFMDVCIDNGNDHHILWSTVAQEWEQNTCVHHKYTPNPSHTIH